MGGGEGLDPGIWQCKMQQWLEFVFQFVVQSFKMHSVNFVVFLIC
jgi:hypothetical protein